MRSSPQPILFPLLLALVLILTLGPTPSPLGAQDLCPSVQNANGPQVHARVGSYKRQHIVDRQEAIYNPPPGCYIRDCRARIVGAFGLHSHSVSMLAADSSFLSQKQVKELYDLEIKYAQDTAVELGGEEFKVKVVKELKDQLKQQLDYLASLESSHQACRLYAQATGRGTFVDKGSSIHLTADVTLCCGLEELQSTEKLQRHLRSKVEKLLAQSPTGRWTPWLNRDAPSGTGDWETVADFRKTGQVCAEPKQIQCRLRGSKQVVNAGHVNGREQVVCDIAIGGVCDNRRQSPGVRCSDYEVRFLCP